MDPESTYPEGDGFIPIDTTGCILFFANAYFHESAQVESILNERSNEDLLTMHRSLVNAYFDEPTLNMIDAVVLIGMLVSKRLTNKDFPEFAVPNDLTAAEFLEYIQVWRLCTRK